MEQDEYGKFAIYPPCKCGDLLNTVRVVILKFNEVSSLDLT